MIKILIADRSQKMSFAWHLCAASLLIPFLNTVSFPSLLPLPALLSVGGTQIHTIDDLQAADRLFQQGVNQFHSGQVTAAIESWQQALFIYRSLKDRQREGIALTNIGAAYSVTGNYRQAIENWQSFLVIAQETGDVKGEIKALGNLGIAYRALGDYGKAIESHQQSLKIAHSQGNAVGELSALNRLGTICTDLGKHDQAIAYYQKSLVIAQKIGDRSQEAAALANLGVAYQSQGNYHKAIDDYQQQLTIAREIGDRRGQGVALGNLGVTHKALGDYVKAIDYYQQTLTMMREISDRQGEGQALGNLGNAYEALGEYDKAIESYQQSLAIADSIKDTRAQGVVLGNMGGVYDHRGETTKAIKYYQQSLAIARKIGDREGEGHTLNNLGGAYQVQHHNAVAIDCYQQALVIAKEIGNHQVEAAVLSNLGNAYKDLGDLVQARAYQQQSLAIAKKVGDLAAQGEALHNLGLVLFKLGQLPEAEATLLKAIEVRESLRPSLNDTQKISIFDTQFLSYELLQKVLIARNKPEASLEIAERSRARAFVELLARRLSSSHLQTSLPALATANAPTFKQIQQIAKAENATLIEYSLVFEESLFQGKQRGKASELFIWVIHPTGKIVFRRVDLKPFLLENTSLANLIADSRDDLSSRGRSELVAAIKVGAFIRCQGDPPDFPPRQVVAVNTQKGTVTLKFPSNPPDAPTEEIPLADAIPVISATATPNRGLQQLYQLLIQPIADQLPNNSLSRVVFIPQQELFNVPFAALQNSDGSYLIEKHTILTSPAIQVLDLTHRQQRNLSGSADVLVVGNPTMPKVGNPPEQLPPLPGSEQEAQAIATLLNTKALIGNQATKTAVLERISQAKLIHLATHGLLGNFGNKDVPGAVALAPSPNDDGLLRASEILNLKLHAELVVLSACNTGRGRITGDGIIGLSRSLFIAGVPSVVVSLWAVSDGPTALLMTEFYRFLQRDADKAQALRQAMLATMKQHPNPIDWAAFTLIGEADGRGRSN